MALVKAKKVADGRPITYDNPIAALIQQRRYQVLVHSLLYYQLDTNIVSDATWWKWALELVQLQKDYPDIASKVIFAEAFKDFDGSTGYDLPYTDQQIVNIAYRMLLREGYDKDGPIVTRLTHRTSRTPAEYDTYKKQIHVDKPTATKSTKKEVKAVEQKPRKGLFSVSRK